MVKRRHCMHAWPVPVGLHSCTPFPPSPPLPAGMVIAVKGTVKASGEMLVDDWCPAGLPPPVPAPSKNVSYRVVGT